MKLIGLILLVALFSNAAFADVSVKGYNRRDGTYVQPHYRSDPNSNKYDNWSTKGNVNPYTGREGTKNLDNSQQDPVFKDDVNETNR